MKTAIRKMGNSQGVIIPKPLLAEIGAAANDQVDMTVEQGRIVIAPLNDDPRAGWAEESNDLPKQDRAVWSGRSFPIRTIRILNDEARL
jgi:antitoxin MazE